MSFSHRIHDRGSHGWSLLWTMWQAVRIPRAQSPSWYRHVPLGNGRSSSTVPNEHVLVTSPALAGSDTAIAEICQMKLMGFGGPHQLLIVFLNGANFW